MAQCQARDWMAALATLERNHRLGALEAGEMRRAKAALLAAHGLDLRSSRPKEALQTALKALKIDPGLTPAAVTAASVLADDGRRRQAARIIEAAWRLLPHPDLAEAYLGLRPHLPAVERAKQIARLAALTPDHEEARVALDELTSPRANLPRLARRSRPWRMRVRPRGSAFSWRRSRRRRTA